ncbi:uncharacterized protein RCC_02453 [Ramularia collo-cygni]|uniref:CBM1 domain-containing protein n=1 Tax=Ramularia collo-cygni TaxID=112498 RepID=A0A2D3V553_9PEZI|nr:uncharacterized protein RCC_02453 [Ramularia collo-cygni]CZT16619.1 uncharacterized protein RCC_02453 [Ramularia collo-cygni]
MIIAAVAALSVGAHAQAATACCTNHGDCTTISGTTDGLHWCYGYHAGQHSLYRG